MLSRRGFIGRCISALAAPAIVRASSLWLPPERPAIVTPDELSFDDLQQAFANAEAGGLAISHVYVNQATWDILMTDMGALKRYRTAPIAARGQAARSLAAFHAGGMVNITPSAYVRSGEALMIETKRNRCDPYGAVGKLPAASDVRYGLLRHRRPDWVMK